MLLLAGVFCGFVCISGMCLAGILHCTANTATAATLLARHYLLGADVRCVCVSVCLSVTRNWQSLCIAALLQDADGVL